MYIHGRRVRKRLSQITVCPCFRTEVQFLEELGGNGYAACGTDSVEGVLGVVVGGEVDGWGSSWRGVSSDLEGGLGWERKED